MPNSFLLAADTHFVDSSIDEYRWRIFDFLSEASVKHKVNAIYFLGDTVDRKDRHTSRLVNRVVDSLDKLHKDTNAFISILAGNHDSPLEGVPYWKFLNKHEGISYVTEPEYHFESIWVLPFSPNPVRDWKSIPWYDPKYRCDAIFMHQPIQGAFIDEYRKIKDAPILPDLPKVPIFSGDIHNPQTFNGITYIGVPHPTKFDESWRNRILLIENSNWENYKEIWLPTIKRAILHIKDPSELDKTNFKKEDQVRIKVSLDNKHIASWLEDEKKIRKWAEKNEVYIASVEATTEGSPVRMESISQESLELKDPTKVLKEYAEQESLSEEIVDAGVVLLQESV